MCYTTKKNKIAVIGEGPVGLVVLLYLLKQKIDCKLNDLEIYFHYSRNKFVWRHIVNLSGKTNEDIYCLYNDYTKRLKKENLYIAILCLEEMFYTPLLEGEFIQQIHNVDSKHKSMDTRFCVLSHYDHVCLHMVLHTFAHLKRRFND